MEQSVCCGVDMPDYPDSDLCPRCKEHTVTEKEYEQSVDAYEEKCEIMRGDGDDI